MKRRMICCVALFLLLLGACASIHPSDSVQDLHLYFVSQQSHGPAIVEQAYRDGTDSSPEELIHALLAGPTDENLSSPFPAGLTLRNCTLEDSHLIVDLSEQYGGLTDVALTLADYCVVLTVCQLDGVDSVEITVSGQSMAYRSHQVLTLDEAILATQ